MKHTSLGKRLLTLLVSLVMVCSLAPTLALAANEDPNAGKVQFGIVIDGNPSVIYVEPGLDFDLPAVTAPEGKVLAGWSVEAQFVNGFVDKSVLPADTKSINISSMTTAVLVQPVFEDEPVDPNAGKVQFGIVIDGNPSVIYVEPGYVFDLPAVTAPEGQVLAGWSVEAQFVDGSVDKSVLPADTKSINISAMTTAVLVQPVFEDEPVDPNAGKVQFGIVIDGNLNSVYVEPGYVFDLPAVTAPEGQVLAGWSVEAQFVDGSVDKSVLPADTKSINISAMTTAVLVQPVFEDEPVDPNAGKVQFGIVIDGNLNSTYVEPGYIFDLPAVTAPEGKVLAGWNVQAQFVDGSVDEQVLPADTKSINISAMTTAILVQPVFEDAPVASPKPSEQPSESPEPSERPSESPKPSEQPGETPKPTEKPSESPVPTKNPEKPTATQAPADEHPEIAQAKADGTWGKDEKNTTATATAASTATKSTAAANGFPQTGDSGNLVLWISLLALSGLGLAAAVMLKRRFQ